MRAETKAMPHTRIMSKIGNGFTQCHHQYSDRCNVTNVESWDTDWVFRCLKYERHTIRADKIGL